MPLKKIAPLFLFLSITCFSQEFTVSANVKDLKNEPIPYANVVVAKKIKDLSVKRYGTSTNENGCFVLKNLSGGDYVISISFLGYKTYKKDIKITKNLKLNDIILSDDFEILEGVDIIAKKPTIKRLVDRLVFNVENSTLSNTNALDVLKHAPEVFVIGGKITLKNSTPIIYINNRRVYLSIEEIQQFLEGTTATNIKAVEVITNPPVKYEAEGGGVINIITTKNLFPGYNGNVYGSYKQGFEFPKYSFGTSHYFKVKKINTYLNYNISPRKDYRNTFESLKFTDNTYWETDFNRINKTNNQNINANFNYTINDKNSLGLSTNILLAPKKQTKKAINASTRIFNSNKQLDSMFNTVNNKKSDIFNFAISLDYKHKFKKQGELLTANVHHTHYDFLDLQNVSTEYFLPNSNDSFRDNAFQTLSSQKITLFTGQLDYELPINDSHNFELGLKFSNIDSKNTLEHFIFKNNKKAKDEQNSDVFEYNELNYAAYGDYASELSHWSFKTGLRIEYTLTNGNSLSTAKKNTNKYIKLFPSVHVLNTVNENNEWYFSYNKRIHRPKYNQLNPFKYFLNDKTYIQGDPSLKPQLDDVFTLGYTLKRAYTFELNYHYKKSPTYQIVFQNNTNNLLEYINTNIDSSIYYGLDFLIDKRLAKSWSLYALFSAYYSKNKFYPVDNSVSVLENVEKWSFYSQVINYFTFLKDKSLTINVSYLYISPLVDGVSSIGPRSSVDIS